MTQVSLVGGSVDSNVNSTANGHMRREGMGLVTISWGLYMLLFILVVHIENKHYSHFLKK